MFKKINLPILNLNIDTILGNQISSYPNFFQYSTNIGILEDLQFQITPFLINVTKITSPGVSPHIDGPPVALNYYLNAGQNSTKFWKTRNSSDMNKFNDDVPKKFLLADLIQVNEFVANTHDWYLFDTKVIHSVTMPKDSDPRFILRFFWKDHSFDEILNSLLL